MSMLATWRCNQLVKVPGFCNQICNASQHEAKMCKFAERYDHLTGILRLNWYIETFSSQTLPCCECFALPDILCVCLSTCLSACLPFSSRGSSYGQWLAAASCVGGVVVRSRRRKRRRRWKAVLSVAPTFFHLLYVTVAADPVIHLLPVGLLAAAQHRQRAPCLLHHVHDAVQELQWGEIVDK